MNPNQQKLLTNSRLECARRCPREEKFKYQVGYRPVADAAELAFGSLVHLALEAWWLGVKAGLPIDQWLEQAWAALRAQKGVDPFDLVKAEVMVAGYHYRWGADAANYEVLAVEVTFDAPVVNPASGAESRTWRLGGKLDVLVRDRRDGEVRFIEHKTSGEDVSLGSNYWRRLRIDSQVSTYFTGAEALGHRAVGCVYDVLGKPALRPSQVPVLDERGNKVVLDATGERVRTTQGKWRQTGDSQQGYVLQTRDETPDEYKARLVEAITKEPDRYFVRGEVVRLEQELADAQADIWATAQALRENERLGRAPRNAKACQRPGGWCPFFDVCTGAASLDDPRLFRRVTDIHPELAGEAAPQPPALERGATNDSSPTETAGGSTAA